MRQLLNTEIQSISGGATDPAAPSPSPLLGLLTLPLRLIGGVLGLALLLDMLKDTGGYTR